ncbi:hypothetical protein MJN39_24610, partial [Salmonella enterica subsp. enterica serovar Kentucky]|nr:hypothetical protein [Salmonella enterica subsp. enterica serovar Kentucky]
LDVIIPILSDVEVIQLLAVNPGYGSKMRSSDLHERVAQLLCLHNQRELKVLKRAEGDGEGFIVIDDLVDTGGTAVAIREMYPKA